MSVKEENESSDSCSDLNFAKICRACLQESGNMKSVFDNIDDTGSGAFFEMIARLSDIQITSGDGLPDYICIGCIRKINTINAFKKLCQQSDNQLRIYIKKPSAVEIFRSDDSASVEDDAITYDNEQRIPNEPGKNKKLQVVKSKTDTEETPQDDLNIVVISDTADPEKKRKGPFTCNVCHKTYVFKTHLKKHLLNHAGFKPYKCRHCGRCYTEEIYLKNHIRTHIPETLKPLQCEVCGKRFIHKNLLTKHMQRHSEEKPHVCDICGKGCYARNSLEKHMQLHIRSKSLLNELDPNSARVLCEFCRGEFDDAEALKNHMQEHSGSRPYMCIICSKSFRQRATLDLHLRAHTGERPYTCELCHNGYVSKAILKIHMRTHTNERPYACEVCGRAFRQSGDLISHKRLHGTNNPIECKVCSKKFTTVMKLKYHMRNHTGERPYVCNICNRGFTINSVMLRHMRVHSGERPHVCATCGKAFSQLSILNSHMRTHRHDKNKSSQVLDAIDEYQDCLSTHHQRECKSDYEIQEDDVDEVQEDTRDAIVTELKPNRMLIAGENVEDKLLGSFGDDNVLNEGTRLVVRVADPPRLLLRNGNIIQSANHSSEN